MLELAALLADGRFHSGQRLAETLGVSRTAIWKQTRRLAELGLQVQSVRGRGYRLSQPLELLSSQAITEALEPQVADRLGPLHILAQIDSTNDFLAARLADPAAQGAVCLAEYQHRGRGRRGREWRSPFGRNLYLSLLWRFPCGPAAMQGLSLAVGTALIAALEQIGLQGAGLKWPNDILVDGSKLAGILIDMSGEAGGPTAAVIGVGINVAMPADAGSGIGQAWTDLRTQLDETVSRNRLAAGVLNHLVTAVREYEQTGLAGFQPAWQRHDLAHNRAVTVHLPQGEVAGQARGIDESGALIVEIEGRERRFSSGEISLRLNTE
ncbi:bifunctional biotin--[acetyl-CoA-carboxylase] ligase/biotin operon repressor BirA [Thiohalobacter thiocyanaticus]|uniref:Bifunctional ligase/repressor BirA n=1 Tax=Thiohalobacter thiocyanaticus TaxID=585455 RepID=A0A426QL12_9GAMM|nr:bifunctional biotin--[acetyl-CoA-carboxylase] ligase/biotin operon repressor BirA [Thiohalobacter thiocyanaticus]RRQ22440.1 bifunctional biotin--[acetyl-CoA-carboxylase] ligase/biotin operon repressor BirA [Thiohalobacter thiocyanaticus]